MREFIYAIAWGWDILEVVEQYSYLNNHTLSTTLKTPVFLNTIRIVHKNSTYILYYIINVYH